jgi:PAS domain S-box-containing protein
MTWNYAYTPTIWPPIIAVPLLSALAAYSWRRRQIPGALPLLAWALIGCLSLVGAAFKAAAVAPTAKITWFIFIDLTLLPSVTAAACFALEYAWPGRWLTRRNLVLLSLPCLLAIFMEVTNGARLMYSTLEIGPDGSVIEHMTSPGAVLTIYGLSLFLLNMIALLWLFVRSPQHRWPVALLLVAQAAVRGLFLLQEVVHKPLLPAPVYDVVSMILPGIAYALALFGFRLFDPVALARLTVMEQLSDGMLVLDRQGRVASLNPAAERIFGLPAGQIKGRSVREVLPAYPEGLQPVSSGTEIEFSLSAGGSASDYRLAISRLNDWRGLEVGRLLLLNDVTGQKRAQAQILEQQRALATLREREHLARELHDSLGQVLGYTGFQLEAVQGRIQDGQAAISAGQAQGKGLASASANLAEAGSQLERLSSIVEEAHADVREYILNLRLAPSDERPFFATLQHYLDGFSQNYGIQAELSVGPGIGEQTFGPGAQMQLYRIIQEALSNARRHAGASRVTVAFAMLDGRAHIRIQDNGRGFDPQRANGESRFGLRFMRERAEELGGCLAVISQPGQGACVEVEVPIVKGDAEMGGHGDAEMGETGDAETRGKGSAHA